MNIVGGTGLEFWCGITLIGQNLTHSHRFWAHTQSAYTYIGYIKEYNGSVRQILKQQQPNIPAAKLWDALKNIYMVVIFPMVGLLVSKLWPVEMLSG